MAPSIPQLLIILVIVLLLFGAKRLRNLGTDLGAAVKGFKSAVKDGSEGEDKDNDKKDTAEATVQLKEESEQAAPAAQTTAKAEDKA